MIRTSLIFLALMAAPAFAEPPQVASVTVSRSGGGFTFSVTIAHPDTGWDHYVDSWRVTDLDGNVLGERKLAHPHVDEQPFTRSLSGVFIPDSVDTVVIEAHDTVSGWGEQVQQVKIR